MLLDVIVEHTNRVVGATLIPHFPSPPTPKSQHLVVLQPTHNCDLSGIIDFFLHLTVLGSLVEHRTFVGNAGRSVKEQGQLDTMGLRWGH